MQPQSAQKFKTASTPRTGSASGNPHGVANPAEQSALIPAADFSRPVLWCRLRLPKMQRVVQISEAIHRREPWSKHRGFHDSTILSKSNLSSNEADTSVPTPAVGVALARISLSSEPEFTQLSDPAFAFVIHHLILLSPDISGVYPITNRFKFFQR